MKSHPGGIAYTRHMLEAARLPEGAKIFDMGAGAGEAVSLMRALGYDAYGIDISPRPPLVQEGDFLQSHWPNGTFDAVLSECSFFISGDVPQALREAHRLLKPGGLLLLSDVFFEDPVFLLRRASFVPAFQEDLTAAWREYYLEALWREETPPCIPAKGKCTYWFLIGRKC